MNNRTPYDHCQYVVVAPGGTVDDELARAASPQAAMTAISTMAAEDPTHNGYDVVRRSDNARVAIYRPCRNTGMWRFVYAGKVEDLR